VTANAVSLDSYGSFVFLLFKQSKAGESIHLENRDKIKKARENPGWRPREEN
jgi:hypothetical protein